MEEPPRKRPRVADEGAAYEHFQKRREYVAALVGCAREKAPLVAQLHGTAGGGAANKQLAEKNKPTIDNDVLNEQCPILSI